MPRWSLWRVSGSWLKVTCTTSLNRLSFVAQRTMFWWISEPFGASATWRQGMSVPFSFSDFTERYIVRPPSRIQRWMPLGNFVSQLS